MKLRLAALIASYVIAITAVFVIWPAVGTAPWETDTEEIYVQPANTVQPRAEPDLVGRIVIPELGLEAPLVMLGVNSDGVMQTPYGKRVAWYNFSARPGEGSNVVLAGLRIDHPGGAAFPGLHDLRAGDTIILLWEDGRKYSYRLISYEAPPNPESHLESIIGSTDQDVITLIGTCGTTDLCPRLILRAELVS